MLLISETILLTCKSNYSHLKTTISTWKNNLIHMWELTHLRTILLTCKSNSTHIWEQLYSFTCENNFIYRALRIKTSRYRLLGRTRRGHIRRWRSDVARRARSRRPDAARRAELSPTRLQCRTRVPIGPLVVRHRPVHSYQPRKHRLVWSTLEYWAWFASPD